MNKTQTAMFDEWYKYFPKKQARGAGEKAWETLDPDEELVKKMTLAVQAQVRYKKQAGDFNLKYFKSPGPWITQKCWLDEIGSHAELKEKAAAKICCIEDCHSQTMGKRFPVCEHHFQFNKAGRLRGYLGLVDELRNRYASKPEIQGLRGREALTYIKRKIGDIGRG